MTLLTILSLIYAAVLVLALAASLILILVYLYRIAHMLGEARGALALVSERTAGLHEPLASVGAAVETAGGGLEQAANSLEEAETHLATLAPTKEAAAGHREQ